MMPAPNMPPVGKIAVRASWGLRLNAKARPPDGADASDTSSVSPLRAGARARMKGLTGTPVRCVRPVRDTGGAALNPKANGVGTGSGNCSRYVKIKSKKPSPPHTFSIVMGPS
jgi:hypothetical protein